MTDIVLKRVTFKDVWEKLSEISEISQSRTDKLYIEMHAETLKDLLCDPDLDSYISYSRPAILDREKVETLFGARIFTHTDSSKRFMLTIAYRADVLIGEEDNEIKIPKGNMG